jgi:hypothetical protein
MAHVRFGVNRVTMTQHRPLPVYPDERTVFSAERNGFRNGLPAAYRQSMIALSIIKSRSCDSKLNSVRLIILWPVVLVVLVGLQAKPSEGKFEILAIVPRAKKSPPA